MIASKIKTIRTPMKRLKFDKALFLEPNAEISQYSQNIIQQTMTALPKGNMLLV